MPYIRYLPAKRKDNIYKLSFCYNCMLSVLGQLGLTKNEIKIYQYLYQHGDCTTGPLIDNLGLSSSRVYSALNALIKKGIVSYYLKNNVKYFQASEPEFLLKKWDDSRLQIVESIRSLKNSHEKTESEKFSAIYEGFHGFKQVFDLMLRELTKEDELFTIGFSADIWGLEILQRYLKQYDRERYRKKVWMKIIMNKDMKRTIGKERESEPYTQVRYLPEGYITPAALSLFKDYVVHWVWGKNPTIFVLKNSEVNASFRTYFRAIWGIAKK